MSQSPIQVAMEHRRLKADLDEARTYGDGRWIQEALGALTRFVEDGTNHDNQIHDKVLQRRPRRLVRDYRPRPWQVGTPHGIWFSGRSLPWLSSTYVSCLPRLAPSRHSRRRSHGRWGTPGGPASFYT